MVFAEVVKGMGCGVKNGLRCKVPCANAWREAGRTRSIQVKGATMEDRDAIVPLSNAEEAICSYFIENPIAMRHVIQMMPHGDLPLDFLQKLWSYAATRNRKVDLANTLLYFRF